MLAGVSLALAGLAPAAVAADAPARTTMVRLSIADVPAAGLTGFSGVLGQVAANPPQQLSTWDGGDQSGVLGHLGGWYGGPAGPGTATAQVNDSVSARDASAGWAGIGVRLRSGTGPNVISVGSLHTYARCTTTPLQDSQEAYAASDSNALYLFDSVVRPLSDGTQTVTSSGRELGLTGVGTATLSITVRRVQETGPLTAHAKIEVSVDAVLNDTSGAALYTGRLLDATFGEVTVDCAASTEPTSSTTTTTTTTTSGGTTTTGSSSGSATSSTATLTSGAVAMPGSGGDSLAGTGFRAGPVVGLGLLLVIGGAVLTLLRRSRAAR